MEHEEINLERFIVAKWELNDLEYTVFRFSRQEFETFPYEFSRHIVEHLAYFLSPKKDPESLRKCRHYIGQTNINGRFFIMERKTD